MPFIPPGDQEILKETIEMLVRKQMHQHYAFLCPNSIDGLAEEIAEKHDMRFHQARQIVIGLAAEAAIKFLDEIQ